MDIKQPSDLEIKNKDLIQKLNMIDDENKQLKQDKLKLIKDIETQTNELKDLYKMINSVKLSYLQEQTNLNKENIKVKRDISKLEKTNKNLQARLRAYKNSKLGRVTTWYWNLRKK